MAVISTRILLCLPFIEVETAYETYAVYFLARVEKLKVPSLIVNLLQVLLDFYAHVFFLLFFQGGFARVHELTDLTTNITYAGKIIPKSRITKPHHKEKVSYHTLILQE